MHGGGCYYGGGGGDGTYMVVAVAVAMAVAMAVAVAVACKGRDCGNNGGSGIGSYARVDGNGISV